MPLSVEDGKRLIEIEAEMARRGELPAGGAGRDLTDTLYGRGTAAPASDVWTSKTGWTKAMVEQRIRSEAVKQKVDPNLAVAVAYHESGFDPDIEGDGGNAHGVFQLHKGAATDAGINPKFRKDPDLNIYGGVRYLKMKLDQSKGNVEEALSRYNRGTPDYRGIGDPNYIQRVLRYYPGTSQPQQTAQPSQTGLLARMGQALSPASAEAATPAPRPAPQVPAAPRSRLEELEAELARRDAQPGTYTDADVQNAMKTLQTPQTPTGGTYTNEDVQNALRSLQGTTAPAPAGRDLTQELFGTPPQAQPGQAPAEEPITPERRFLDLPSSRQMSLEDRTQRFKEFYRLKPALKEEFLRSEEPPSALTIDIEKPSPQAAGGAAAQTPRAAPISAPAPGAEMEGNLLSDRSQVAEGGEQVPLSTAFPAAAKQTAATAINAVPFAVGTLAGGPVTGAIAESILQPVAHEVNVRLGLEERGPAWFSIKGHPVDTQHILGAALPWVGPGVQAGLKVHRAGRALTAADTATQEAIDAAQATYNKAHADYLANKISYKEAEAIQSQAVAKVRQLPGTYAPATPSRELYQQMADAAPNAPVDLAPMLQQIPAWRQSVQHAGPQVGQILDKIEAMGNTTDVARLYNEVMKDLGRLTSRGNGAARGVATEMYGAVHDALEASALQIPGTAVAADVLKAARTSFRREKAVENLERIVQPGGTVVKYDNQGRLVVNPAMLQNRVEKLIGQDRFFAGSFQPDELAQLRSDVGSFAGTPKIPTRVPEAPPPMEMPPHVEPQLTPLINRPGRKALYGAEAVASLASGRMPSHFEFALMAADVVSQGIAKLLLVPGGRDMLRRAIRADGVLDPAIYPMIGQLGVAKEIDTYRQPKTR